MPPLSKILKIVAFFSLPLWFIPVLCLGCLAWLIAETIDDYHEFTD